MRRQQPIVKRFLFLCRCVMRVRALPWSYLPLPHKGPKNSRGSEAKQSERVAVAEQTNLMRVHNDTNLNDNARCVCLED